MNKICIFIGKYQIWQVTEDSIFIIDTEQREGGTFSIEDFIEAIENFFNQKF